MCRSNQSNESGSFSKPRGFATVLFVVLLKLCGENEQLVDVLGRDPERLGSDSLDDGLLARVEGQIGAALIEVS
jgi:hypothetical protein